MPAAPNDYVYFAFIDILGYRNFLSKDISTSSLDFKEKLLNAFAVFRDINQAEIHYKSISDSIFIYSPNNIELLLDALKKIYVAFLKNQLLVRGGVSYNRHFENGTITYSLALTEAYALESKKAVYPRIILHDAVIQKIRNESTPDNNMIERISRSNLLMIDGDTHFINVLDQENWDTIYTQAQQIYINDKEAIDSDEQLRIKHKWLHDYIMNRKPARSRKPHYLESFCTIT